MDFNFNINSPSNSMHFILHTNLELNESIDSNRLLFKTIHIFHDNNGNTIEKNHLYWKTVARSIKTLQV